MNPENYIAYEGEIYTIEWFFDENGKSQSLNYAESLTKQDKLKLLGLLSLMGSTGKIQNKEKFRNEGGQIYAFKPHPHRFLCFFYRDKKIIITNAFEKSLTNCLSMKKKEV